MNEKGMNETEQKILVLNIVKECLAYANENKREFAEVLEEGEFVVDGKVRSFAYGNFSDMVCSTIKLLHEEGYLSGDVEIEYEKVYDLENDVETPLDTIDPSMCIFENIALTEKGRRFISSEGMEGQKEKISPGFGEKVKGVLKIAGKVVIEQGVNVAIMKMIP